MRAALLLRRVDAMPMLRGSAFLANDDDHNDMLSELRALVDECDDALGRSSKISPTSSMATLPCKNIKMEGELEETKARCEAAVAKAIAEANAAEVARKNAETAIAEARTATEAASAARAAEAAAQARAETANTEARTAADAASAARAAEAAVQARAETIESELASLQDCLYCPLTAELYADPVCTSDGHTYEREAIEEAWRVGRELAEARSRGEDGDACGACCEHGEPEPYQLRSPSTGAVVSELLVPNHLVIRLIEALIASGGVEAGEAAEWRERRTSTLEAQRARRPVSAPAAGAVLAAPARKAPLAGVARRVVRSASFGKRAASAVVAYPREVLSRASARAEARQLQAAEQRRHEVNEKATQAALRRFHQCPNCQVYLEKAGGCDHFTCRGSGGCGHEFCWLCDAPYRGPRGIFQVGNSAHAEHCPHHRLSLDGR